MVIRMYLINFLKFLNNEKGVWVYTHRVYSTGSLTYNGRSECGILFSYYHLSPFLGILDDYCCCYIPFRWSKAQLYVTDFQKKTPSIRRWFLYEEIPNIIY